MRCPSCNSLDTQVKDSRPTEDSAVIRRRRVCVACNFRFTTFERVQLRELTVIKRNGRRVPFDRDKLVRSLQISLRRVAWWSSWLPSICLVNRLLIRIRIRTSGKAGRLHECPEVFQGDGSVDLDQRPLDDVFQLPAIDRPRTDEAEEVPPRFRGKPASFVGAKNTERHTY